MKVLTRALDLPVTWRTHVGRTLSHILRKTTAGTAAACATPDTTGSSANKMFVCAGENYGITKGTTLQNKTWERVS